MFCGIQVLVSGFELWVCPMAAGRIRINYFPVFSYSHDGTDKAELYLALISRSPKPDSVITGERTDNYSAGQRDRLCFDYDV